MARASSAASPPPVSDVRRVVAASFFGTAMETYDLFIYGTSAALVFGPLFFPNQSSTAATLLSLSTFAVSFIARPVGAVVFGHFGDRVGRKCILMITLLLMGVSTFVIGLLPTYETIGVAAPLLLVILRFLQGFGFGGEYGGAALIIAEHAPPEKRGFYTGLNNVGPPAGFIASTGVFLLVTSILSDEQFQSWGWRIPFLVSIVLVAIGLYIRIKIEESPIFEEAVQSESRLKVPLISLVRHYPRELALATGSLLLVFGTFYIFSVYSLSYTTTRLAVPRSTVLIAVLVASVVQCLSTTYFSAVSDRVGRRKVVVAGMILTALWAFPLFWLIDTANPVLLTLSLCVLMVFYGMLYGPVGAFLGELFGTRVRFTGISLSYNLGSIFGAALAPIIATLLVTRADASWPLSLYIIFLAVISLACATGLPETRESDFSADRTAPPINLELGTAAQEEVAEPLHGH